MSATPSCTKQAVWSPISNKIKLLLQDIREQSSQRFVRHSNKDNSYEKWRLSFDESGSISVPIPLL